MAEIREKFTNDFILKLYGKIADSDLHIVKNELQMFIENYDLTERETAVATCSDSIYNYYQGFIVSKKIEGLNESSLKTYHYYLIDFIEQTTKPIEKITINDIRIYLYNLQQRRKISNRSLDSRRVVINNFFSFCVMEGYIPFNPCEKIGNIKFEKKERKPLSPVELELLRSACKTDREKAIVEVLYSTGCRVTELVRLNKYDVDFQTKEVHLFGKGNKHRTSYLNAKSEVALKKYLSTRSDNEDALFVSDRKPFKRLCKSSIEAIISKLGKKSNIGRNVYPHLIRHTTATDAINKGMNVTSLQKLLGHEKIDTTMIYAKINQTEIKYEHNKFIA